MTARKPTRQSGTHGSNRAKSATPVPESPGVSAAAYALGIVLTSLSAAMSLMLALEHLGGLSLPGCGEGSGCAEAAASVWGTVPYVNWSVSFLGLAYFPGLLVVWLVSRRGLAVGVRHLVRFGALISVGFTVIMIVEGHLCQYCLVLHVANFLFWVLTERTPVVAGASLRGLVTVVAVFAVCSGVLGVIERHRREAAELKAEEDLAAATEAIIAATSQEASEPEDVSEPVAVVDQPTDEPDEPGVTDTQPAGRGFTGRYRLGPERAAIRVVVISDYQCRECRRIEGDVMRLFRQRDDMSVSAKHFPMCSDCNRNAQRRRHPNACWAARAAEAAGILRGDDGFWEMHIWLFEQRGSFTRDSLTEQLREFGYDPAEFMRIMSGDETLELVRADVEEVIGMGIWFTPTIYINGVELRGWEAPRAVARAIQKLAETNPEPLTAAHDHPPAGVEKLIGDWQAQPLRRIPPAPAFRASGPEDAAVRIVMFGDYQQGGTPDTDAVIREAMAQRDDVRYEYRHFPFSPECNPVMKRETDSVHSCRAARAGEAAGRLGGAEAYWKMHAWLLENQEDFSDQALRTAAETIGLDPAALLAEIEKPATGEAVHADTSIGGRVGADKVPSLYLNGRRVQRWKLEGVSIMSEMFDAAAAE